MNLIVRWFSGHILARDVPDKFAIIVPRLLLITLLISATAGCSIGPYTRYVASKIDGRIMKSGKPLVNVRVTREITADSSDEKTVQSAITDSAGHFYFEEVTAKGFFKSIATWVYRFTIHVTVDEREILIWKGTKLETSRFGDFKQANGFFEKHGDILTFTRDIDLPDPRLLESPLSNH